MSPLDVTPAHATIAERGSDAVVNTYGTRQATFTRGVGSLLFDAEGRDYLDLVAGIAVVALGHGHPAPVQALAEQATRLVHVSNLYWTEPGVALAERLLALSGLDRVFFCNSGAEANEGLIKLARRRGQARGGPAKHGIVCVERAFHGRTLGALAATWARPKKDPFEPLPTGFAHVPPDDIAALRAAVGPDTAGILLEPIQGEGGVWPLDPAFIAEARALADEHDALLLLDEVQTGVGRTGTWFAYQGLGVRPDAIALAKGLGSGFAIGAVVVGPVEDGFAIGDHGTTFGGSPAIAAASLAVLDAIEREGLLENARTTGDLLARRLAEVPGVAGVRGAGLLRGVELAGGDSGTVARRLLEEHRVVVNAITPTALRLCPPLCLTSSEVERAVLALAAVLAG